MRHIFLLPLVLFLSAMSVAQVSSVQIDSIFAALKSTNAPGAAVLVVRNGRPVFRQNDPDSVQRRARVAMFALNGLLLLALAFALERVFNAAVSLGTLLFLAIDPTVAAHLPVVMTDLPVALLSTTSAVLAARAFREWIWSDLAACSAFLGLALTAKHSAPVVLLSVTLIGTLLAVFQPPSSQNSRASKLAKVALVFVGAMVIL